MAAATNSPDAVRAIEAAAALLGPRRAVVVDILPWMTRAESLAATSSLLRGNDSEALNRAEARRIAGRGAEIARSAGFRAETRAASSRVPPGKESSTSPTSSTPP